MQDIIPPQKKPAKKSLKIILIILAVLLIVLIAVTVTYFLTKERFQSAESSPKNNSNLTSKDVSTSNKSDEFVYITSKSGLNLREDATTVSDIIYTLPYRAKVKLAKKLADNKWYKGTFEDATGWFSIDYAQKEEIEDPTADWQGFESPNSGYSLKFPSDWRKKTLASDGYDFEIIPKDVGGVEISIAFKEQTLGKEKETLVDANHTIAAKSAIFVDGAKGERIVLQKTKDSKIVYTTDVLLLERDGKLIRIEGPADGEDFGDVFDILVWTIKFKVLQ